MPQPAKVMTLEQFERIPGPGSLTWLPVRHTLGIEAFGTNAYVAGAAGEDVVERHTETADDDDPGPGHQELYFVARGHATFTIDGAEHDAPAGTYVFIPDPTAMRHAVAREAGTTVLSFGAPPTFEPSAWEWAFRAAGLMREAGKRPQAREILDDARRRFPDNGSILYNLACLDALEGDADAALARLEEAIEQRPEIAGWAREDEDLVALRSLERFRRLVPGP